MDKKQQLSIAADLIDEAKGMLLDCRMIHGDSDERIADIVGAIANPQNRLLSLINEL